LNRDVSCGKHFASLMRDSKGGPVPLWGSPWPPAGL